MGRPPSPRPIETALAAFVSRHRPPTGSKIIMLIGPIAHWWDENWETDEHWDYDAYRTAVSDALVEAGYLVYRPHEAFKGTWNPAAQQVNDTILKISDALVNLNPGVPSHGTDEELELADRLRIPVIYAPARNRGWIEDGQFVQGVIGGDFTSDTDELLERLEHLWATS